VEEILMSCKWCPEDTPLEETGEYPLCWSLSIRIERSPDAARLIVNEMGGGDERAIQDNKTSDWFY
jgi:hypothetical protein